jgi:hypothetical protein
MYSIIMAFSFRTDVSAKNALPPADTPHIWALRAVFGQGSHIYLNES